MAGINLFGDYGNSGGSNNFFSLTGSSSSQSSSFSLSDYASIKNGSYGKLMKAYYKQQEAEEAEASRDSSKTLTTLKGYSDSLQKSASALTENSLWAQQTVTKKDEETGEETTSKDYKWDDIVSAVKAFAEDYNDIISKSADSETKGVLRNAVWMTNATEANKNLLSSVGISVGKDNKLTVDEEKLKKANINTLKTLFSGTSSYADQISQKASALSSAAASKDSSYNKNGSYSGSSSALKSVLDQEV